MAIDIFSPFKDKAAHHVETSQSIFSANQLSGEHWPKIG